MGKWLERARQLEAEDTHANSVISADSPPIGPIGTNGTGSISVFPPPNIARGISRLRGMSTPRGFDPKAWGVAVGDVSRLIADGRAAEALSLGWSIMDLFGVEPPRSDDDYRNGLAVWLAGRPLVLLDADSAIVRVGERHSIFNRRRDRSGCVLVWELGK